MVTNKTEKLHCKENRDCCHGSYTVSWWAEDACRLADAKDPAFVIGKNKTKSAGTGLEGEGETR